MRQSKSSALPWLVAKIKRYLPGVFLLSVLNAVLAYSYIELALLSETIINAATDIMKAGTMSQFSEWLSLPQLYVPALKIAGIIFLQLVLSVVCANIRVRVGGRIEIRLRQSVFDALMGKEYEQFHHYHSGELMNRLTADTGSVSAAVTGIIPSAVSMATKLIGGLIVLARISPIFTAALVGMGLVLMLLSRGYGKYMKLLYKGCQETEGKTRSFMQESFGNLLSIKAFSNEQYIEERLLQYQHANLRMRIKRNMVNNIGHTAIYLLLNGAYYLALVWGAVCLVGGTLSFGTLTALLQIFQQLKMPLRDASSVMPQYYAMLASAERLQELEQLADEERPIDEQEKQRLISTFRAITVRDLSFAYEGENPVLQQTNVTLNKGEIVVLMGESGMGKSTLMKLILSILRPLSGTINVESESGDVPLNASVRCLFSYVPQGNAVVAGTLRENVAFFRTDVSDDRILKSLSLACLDGFVESLPEGLDTPLGERGFDLSEGQAQRVAIARALVNEAPVLLLDECTSALDEATESALLKNIKAMTDKTVLMITHRQAAVNGCDRIWRLRDKRIVDEK